MGLLPVQASMGPVAVVVVEPARAVRWAWLLVYGWGCVQNPCPKLASQTTAVTAFCDLFVDRGTDAPTDASPRTAARQVESCLPRWLLAPVSRTIIGRSVCAAHGVATSDERRVAHPGRR